MVIYEDDRVKLSEEEGRTLRDYREKIPCPPDVLGLSATFVDEDGFERWEGGNYAATNEEIRFSIWLLKRKGVEPPEFLEEIERSINDTRNPYISLI